MKDRKFILYIVIIVFIASLGTLTYRVGSSIKAKKDALFMPLASQVNSLDGKNSSCVLADEIWAWEDLGLLTIMEDGTSSRNQPIFFETSTMGQVRGKVFDHEYEYCERLINGLIGLNGGITNDYSTLPIIYELNSLKN